MSLFRHLHPKRLVGIQHRSDDRRGILSTILQHTSSASSRRFTAWARLKNWESYHRSIACAR
ncbi:hypothetical protein SAMN04488690_0581 [Stenotrophomonas indicatrix]|uniref:Uncharacterized protein n=1 Tax=Stenotrophomonas indicatrix TaxID=2045451 RepID=A0A1W1GUB5_9GAMM|nr:hypothetical protein SAMN04488690_0581 [Stenotrophomonas indicatrix]